MTNEERLEEIKSEIARLEADHNLSSEEFKELKAYKAEAKELEALVEAELEKKSLSVRPLQRRDIQVLQTLVKDYPNFSKLSEGDQLDRIVLILTQVCGFGGVVVETIQTALDQMPHNLSLDIEDHFLNSTWINREGEARKRYVNNFAQAYKLDPGLSLKLIDESKTSTSEEPIRKVVPAKKKLEPQPVEQKPPTSNAKTIAQKPAPAPEAKEPVAPIGTTATSVETPVSTTPVSRQNLIFIGAGVLLVVLVLVIFISF